MSDVNHQPKLANTTLQIVRKIEFMKGRSKTSFFTHEYLTDSIKNQIRSLGYNVKVIKENREFKYEISWE